MLRTLPALLLCVLLCACSDDAAPAATAGPAAAPSATAGASAARELSDDPSAATVDLEVVATATRRVDVLGQLAGTAADGAQDSGVRAFAGEVRTRQAARLKALQDLDGAYGIDCCGTHTEAGSPLESALRADVPRLGRAARADVDVEFLHRLLEHEALLAPALQSEVDAGTHRPAVELARTLVADQAADTEKAGQLLDRLRDAATG